MAQFTVVDKYRVLQSKARSVAKNGSFNFFYLSGTVHYRTKLINQNEMFFERLMESRSNYNINDFVREILVYAIIKCSILNYTVKKGDLKK